MKKLLSIFLGLGLLLTVASPIFAQNSGHKHKKGKKGGGHKSGTRGGPAK